MNLRRSLLLPLVPVYAAALAAERRARRLLGLRRRALASTVISVGSISAGGAGKTPVVLLLADMLRRRDYAVRILTRGYGRSSSAIERVDPEGDAGRFGDEPLLLARRSGVPVYVGADRFQAGLMAEDAAAQIPSGTIVHLLDDGFQHRALARDIDLVLVTRKDIDDILLPAGDLREPLSALREADIIVLREEEAASLEELLSVVTRPELDGRTGAAHRLSGQPVFWRIRRTLTLPGPSARPRRPIVFCGIARPESFTTMLAGEDVEPVAVLPFPDHHAYTGRDVDRLLVEARTHAADGFFTTEKDAVKLTRAMRSRLECIGPLIVPELCVTLLDERAALEQMITMVGRLDRRRRRR